MLIYEYLYCLDDGLVFSHYPEGNKNTPGQVVITQNGQGYVLVVSTTDFGQRYAYHAINGIDIAKKSGTVAWY